MLIGFRFKNFRSFLNEQAFSFLPSTDRTHQATNCVNTGVKAIPRLSKAAIVFGSNASGKSNFVAALETLRDLVLHSASYTEKQFAARYTPCWSRSVAPEPTSFEIDLLLGECRYRYSVSYDSHRVLSERLMVFHTHKAQRWFERRFDRSTNQENWEQFSPRFSGSREMWRKATRPSALFLTTAAQLNSAQLQPLYGWFKTRLDFMHLSKSTGLDRVLPRLKEDGFKSRILEHLKAVDIRVNDVRIAELKSPPGQKRAANALDFECSGHHSDKAQIEFSHPSAGADSTWLRFDHESAGAHRLFGLFGHLFATLDQAKLLVIDDFGLNLHSLVARQFVKLINNPVKSNAQLLLVSHNIALMDLSLFRRDEIWLTRSDESSNSSLHLVARSGVRKHEQIAKGYLRGRYGAVPEIG